MISTNTPIQKDTGTCAPYNVSLSVFLPFRCEPLCPERMSSTNAPIQQQQTGTCAPYNVLTVSVPPFPAGALVVQHHETMFLVYTKNDQYKCTNTKQKASVHVHPYNVLTVGVPPFLAGALVVQHHVLCVQEE